MILLMFYTMLFLGMILICSLIENLITRNPKLEKAVDQWILDNIAKEKCPETAATAQSTKTNVQYKDTIQARRLSR